MKNLNPIDLLLFDILFFKLILMCKFQNVPYALRFEVNNKNFYLEVAGHV